MGEIRAEAVKVTEEKLRPYKLHYGNMRMEIVREFADRLKADLFYKCGDTETCEARRLIDNLVKEMEKEMEGDIRCPEEDSTI